MHSYSIGQDIDKYKLSTKTQLCLQNCSKLTLELCNSPFPVHFNFVNWKSLKGEGRKTDKVNTCAHVLENFVLDKN